MTARFRAIAATLGLAMVLSVSSLPYTAGDAASAASNGRLIPLKSSTGATTEMAWLDGPTGIVFRKPPSAYWNTDRLVAATNRMGAVARKEKVPLVFVYVPRNFEALPNRLPPGWSLGPTNEAKKKLLAAYRANSWTLDLSPVIKGHPEYWFRTDHHWTHAAARASTSHIIPMLRKAGVPVGPAVGAVRMQSDFPPFMGSSARILTDIQGMKADKFVVPISTARMTRCSGAKLSKLTCGFPVYDVKAARKTDPLANRYEVYLGAEKGADVIYGPGKGTIIIGRDSFGLPVATLLAPRFKRVIVIDERRYTGARFGTLIRHFKPDGVLMIHSSIAMHGANFNANLWS